MRFLPLAIACAAACGTTDSDTDRDPTDNPPPPPPPPTKAEQRVLLIGNSQLGFAAQNRPPDLPKALEDFSSLANNNASHLTVDLAQRFGAGCDEMAAEGTGANTPRGKARSGNFDVVVLLPSIGETFRNDACWDIFKADAEGAGAKFAIMATANIASQYPAGFDGLDDNIRAYAAERSVTFVPAGAAWQRVLGSSPRRADLIEMYNADGEHPGVEGTYVYVLSLYGALTGKSVLGAENDLPALRCRPDAPCRSEQEMLECLGGVVDGDWNCEGDNVVFSEGKASFVFESEAAIWQAAVEDELSARE
jgi:hypothetical protein